MLDPADPDGAQQGEGLAHIDKLPSTSSGRTVAWLDLLGLRSS